jgi:MoxR-like ATPase
VPFPSLRELHEIVNRTTGHEIPRPAVVGKKEEILSLGAVARQVPIAPHVQEFALRLVLATHPDNENAPDDIRRFVRYGSSPRGAQALIVAGKVRALMARRFNVAIEDIRAAALPALRHRVLLNFEGQAEGADPDDLIGEALASVASTAAEDVPV